MRSQRLWKDYIIKNKGEIIAAVIKLCGATAQGLYSTKQKIIPMSVITYLDLITGFRKGLRNDNWRRLNRLNTALFRASLWYAKHRGSIVNTSLVEKLSALVEKLKEMKGMRIFKKGFEKAIDMLSKSEEKGVFIWAPQLKYWLRGLDYIFWLGTVR